MDIGPAEARQICAAHGIAVRELTSLVGSFDKKLFIINRELLLRVSATSMALEQEKFARVAALDCVPQIVHLGALERDAGPVYYTLVTYLPGDNYVKACRTTTVAQHTQLGKDVARFLDRLHEIRGAHYDIGLYVPALPPLVGTWREGHTRYWDILDRGSAKLPWQPESIPVVERAYRFLQASVAALDYQAGPRLLHNDLHPRNMLLYRGRLSGVIDWECSQFGEADFELCHFIHWCLYPPEPGVDFRPFLRALFEAAPQCAQVPHLPLRLTLYQIEHELQQIIWRGGQVEALRIPRLVRWMDGDVDRLFREINR